MAQPKTLNFGKFLIELGDGAPTEAFTSVCGFTNKALTFTAESTDVDVPDCDNPEAPAWKQRGISSLSYEVTGSGVLALDHYADWRTWAHSGVPRNIRVHFNDVLANGGGYLQGSAILTSLGNSAALKSDGNKVQAAVTLQSNGPWIWTPAAA